ncbi:MAG: hypothetical protein H6Q89_5658, partial [Myxococcaceae bacterium]|nr:hypothetical protein [Myxococcaceae bacterium]
MHLTHPDPARKGLTLAGTLFLAELGLMLLGQLGASSFGRAWAVGQMLAWVGISAGLMVAAWQLSKALEGSELPKVVVGLGGLLVLLDLFWLWRLLQPEGLSRVPVAVSVLGSAIGVSSVGCWCVLLALLARPKLGWAVPAASVAGMLALVRTTMMLAGMLGVADAFPLLSFPSTYWVRTAISVVIPLVLGVLALSTRAGLEGVAAPAPAGLGP